MITRTRRVAALVAATMVLGIGVSLVPTSTSHAASVVAGGKANTAVSKSKHVSRTYLDNGKTTTLDKRTVHVTVSDTQDLRSLQQINVNWSGAHETDGVANDVNSDYAMNEEYSFDLFECRGVDSTSVPKKDQISPASCWTEFADERFQSAYDDYPAWRSDAYATPKERAAIVDGQPVSKQSTSCQELLDGTEAQRWVPYAGVDGTKYPGGPHACAGQAPEGTPLNLSSLSLPSNETFGVTNAQGKGSAAFDVFTAEDHASLGCSQTVKCSLVAVPIEGISCDAAGAKLPAARRPTGEDADDAKTNCESTGNFTPGELLNNVETSGDPAVDGTLWWSPSNWRNRISFPLTFSEPDNVCDVVSKQKPVDIYGSELMTQATTQWAPHFCLSKRLFDLKHVQTPEPEARTGLASGSIDAAMTSDPPDTPYPTPTVNAPIALSGFGIAFDIDGKNGQPLKHIRLDPRLLAKLLTESYPDQNFVKDTYPVVQGVETLSNNPLNITQDPEFQALNPKVPVSNGDAASTLLTLGSGSDVVEALTSYIDNDPAARAWINGAPDPWGMRVNPNYTKIPLPTNTWPLLDTYEPTDEYQLGRNDCLYANPVPYLPQVAAPTASLFDVGQDMQFAIAQSQVECVLPDPTPGSLAGAKLVAQGREVPGKRFMLGTVSLGDAAREGLSLASLQTDVEPGTPTEFTSAKGRTFVAPTPTSMDAAAKLLAPDSATGTWPVPYSSIRTDTSNQAYPGTMVVYAAIPTQGLGAKLAHDFSEFLQFAAGEGQTPGVSPGDLPAGYLPMTEANGLGQLVSYTKRAAAAVAAQKGVEPSLTTSAKSPPPTSPPTSPPPPSSTPTISSGTGPNSIAPTTPAVSTPPTAPPSPTVAPQPTTTPAALGVTKALTAGLGRDLVPLLAILIVFGGGGAVVLKLFGPRSKP